MNLKTFSFQSHCLKAHMNQKLYPVVCAEAKSMKRICHGCHLSCHRAYNSAILRNHRHAVANYFLGKHRIRNLF